MTHDSIQFSLCLEKEKKKYNIPWKLKSTRQYREYMENLLEYLIYFFQRTEPLQDLDGIFSKLYSGLSSRPGMINHLPDGFSWTLLKCIHEDPLSSTLRVRFCTP
uniref:Uncharacterized protein n=1 Tax=Gossypium raimondii TaxID=29730 RepID=A0A0D2RCM7_GOSRA|nr:hypothetical protein B456_005G1911002 [Gossypium raimondii]KJB27426.1 hypothetical protein B456_005G1911002 [Gossypium raimondii]